jgi:hypothetical protein
MERTMISWNLPNWGTIILMAAGGYAAWAVIRQLLMRQGG